MSAVLGAVIAGGQSVRYGSPKALAMVGGERVVDRVIRALRVVSADVIAIANDAELGAAFGVPFRSDRIVGLGPIGGIDAALAWASELGHDGIFAVGCDMPFVSSKLLAMLHARAQALHVDAVLPESDGPRGVEPLCAWYSVSCLPAIAAAHARDDRRLIGFHQDINIERIAAGDVMQAGDPAVMFMNINTTTDREQADALVASGAYA